jgi:hypothetical protein
VNVAQNAEAVADWDLMKLAQLFVSAFRHPRATELRASRDRHRMVNVVVDRKGVDLMSPKIAMMGDANTGKICGEVLLYVAPLSSTSRNAGRRAAN